MFLLFFAQIGGAKMGAIDGPPYTDIQGKIISVRTALQCILALLHTVTLQPRLKFMLLSENGQRFINFITYKIHPLNAIWLTW